MSIASGDNGVTPAEDIRSPIEALVTHALVSSQPKRVWVAFSGGVDSTALLLASQAVIAELPFDVELIALHVNHNLQPAAANWQRQVERFCREKQIQCLSVAADVAVAGNLEANARESRYQLFAKYVQQTDVLLLGHHQSDQMETVLYRLFQGRGLLPMRAKGRLGEGGFRRPLLPLPRAKLIDYVRAHGATWVEDGSNADVKLARNFLRHEILPLLQKRWRDLHGAVERVVWVQRGSDQALAHEVAKYPDQVALTALPESLAARLAWLRSYLNARHFYTVSDRALTEFCRQMTQTSLAQLHCGESASLYAYADHLHFVKAFNDPSEPTELLRLGEKLSLDHGVLSLEVAVMSSPHTFVYSGPMRVGFRRGGERLGDQSGARSLKQIFNTAKVPPWNRPFYPLLFIREKLVCVPGLAAVNRPAPDESQLCVAHWAPSIEQKTEISG